MNWNNASDFLEMGGYGLYVWGSFGMTALAVAIEVWQLRMRRRHLRSEMRSEMRSEVQSGMRSGMGHEG